MVLELGEIPNDEGLQSVGLVESQSSKIKREMEPWVAVSGVAKGAGSGGVFMFDESFFIYLYYKSWIQRVRYKL